ncbi:MAG: helix-turn-helix transcriptional regulator [Bacteroidales bacterium]|nr:helix-turn-helix transcriptional regulator [Bacteroidales bacterium]
MKIGNKLRSLRIEKNLSTQQVADMLNISESTYRKYETNSASPSLDRLESIAHILKKKLIDLLPEEVVCQSDMDGRFNTNHRLELCPMCEKFINHYEQCIAELKEENKQLKRLNR